MARPWTESENFSRAFQELDERLDRLEAGQAQIMEKLDRLQP